MATISGTINHGIELGTAGAYVSPLTITTGGVVSASGGIAIYGGASQAWTVVNSGYVAGTGPGGWGIALKDGGVVSNGGTIVGGTGLTGVYISRAAGTVVNSGTILGNGTGGDGVGLINGGTVINTSGGLISAGYFGIVLDQFGTVTNSGGTIVGGGTFAAVYLGSGGTVTNAAGGLIQGGKTGITISRGDGTVINSGTISGGGNTAISFVGNVGYSNRLVLEHGYKLTGVVLGAGAAKNTLELRGAAGAVAADFKALSLSNFGTFAFGTASGNDETLKITDTTVLPGTVASFVSFHDIVDLTQFTNPAGAVINLNTATNQLTVAEGTQSVTLQLDAENYSGVVWQAGTDGSGGTDVSAANAVATKTWTGSVSTDWGTAGNWDTNSVPTSADDAVIGTTSTSPVIPLNAGFSVNTLTMNGTDTLTLGDNSNTGNGQGLTAANGFSLGGGASIFGQGTLTGNITTTGSATIGVKAINRQNTPQFTLAGTIDDATDGLTLFVGADSAQQNLNPTNLILQNKSTTNTVHAVTFDTSAAVAGELELLWLGSNLGLTVATQMAVGAGQVFLSGGSSTSDVSLTDASGITLSTGTIFGVGLINAPVTATGAATISTNLGPLEITGPITDSGNALTLALPNAGDKLLLDAAGSTAQAVTLKFGSFTGSFGATLELNSGASLTVGTKLELDSLTTLQLDGGNATITDSAGLNLNGGYIWGAGTILAPIGGGSGQIIATGGTLQLKGGVTGSTNTMTIFGSNDRLVIFGSAQAFTLSFGAGGTLEIAPGATLTFGGGSGATLAMGGGDSGGGTLQLDGPDAAFNLGASTWTLGDSFSITGAGRVTALVMYAGAATITAKGGTLELNTSLNGGNGLTLTMNGVGDVLQLDSDATAQTANFNGGGLYLHSRGGDSVTIGTQMQVGTGAIVMDTSNPAYTPGTLNDAFGITLGGGAIAGFGTINASLTGSGLVLALGGTLELQSAIGSAAGLNFAIANGATNVLQLDSTVGTGNTFSFLGHAGKLGLANDSGFNATISGLNVAIGIGESNFVDIEGHVVTISTVSGQGTTSGTLTLSDGAVLHLTNIDTLNWSAHAVSDGSGGTSIYLNTKRPTADFNGDGVSDVLWRNNSSGDTGYWAISNNAIAGWRGFGDTATNYSIVGVGDFDGDGTSDVLWRNATTGDTGYWAISNVVQTWHDIGASAAAYSVVGTGDFDGDGTADVLWRNNATGDTGYWALTINDAHTWHGFGITPTSYSVVGVGDFEGDGSSDILWRNATTGDTGYWTIANNQLSGWVDLGQAPTTWNVVGVGDFNGDGISDVLWRNVSNGDTGYWRIANNAISGWTDLGQAPTTYTVENGATSAGAEGNALRPQPVFGFDDISLPAMSSDAGAGSAASATTAGSDEPGAPASALALASPDTTVPNLQQ